MAIGLRPATLCGAVIVAATAVALTAGAYAETADKPAINLPNPYSAGVKFGQMPEGRKWGGVIAVAPDRDGKSIWAFERCGGNCLDSDLPAVLEFDPAGKLIKSFGAGMFVFPHGIAVDKEGNVYVADADGKNGKGHTVVKFSPEGKVLMTLGKAGMPGDAPGFFNRPSAVAVAPNGDIFIADGHATNKSNAGRVVKRPAPSACRPQCSRSFATRRGATRRSYRRVEVAGVAADSLGAREVGPLAFAILQEQGVRVLLVEDDAIRAAQRVLWHELRILAEPGGATALAALLSNGYRPEPGERVGVVLCGGNTDPGTVV